MKTRRLLSELLLQLSYLKQTQKFHPRVRSSTTKESSRKRIYNDSIDIDRPKKSKSLTMSDEFCDEASSTSSSLIFSSTSSCKRSLETSIDLEQDNNDKQIVQSQCDENDCDYLVVIAATNRLLDLDEAVLRRFDVKIHVGTPDTETRRMQTLRFLKNVAHNLSDSDLTNIADMTCGWSGSDMETLCREAAMAPLRSVISKLPERGKNLCSSTDSLHFQQCPSLDLLATVSYQQVEVEKTDENKNNSIIGDFIEQINASNDDCSDFRLRQITLYDFEEAHNNIIQQMNEFPN